MNALTLILSHELSLRMIKLESMRLKPYLQMIMTIMIAADGVMPLHSSITMIS